jgi:hypothetical protein
MHRVDEDVTRNPSANDWPSLEGTTRWEWIEKILDTMLCLPVHVNGPPSFEPDRSSTGTYKRLAIELEYSES